MRIGTGCGFGQFALAGGTAVVFGTILVQMAEAAGCTPDPQAGGCFPQQVAVKAFSGGLRVEWQIFDSPLPNSISITRTQQLNLACNEPGPQPAKSFSVPASTSFFDDTTATAGPLWGYQVCSNWDNGPACAPAVCNGRSGSGGGGGPTPPPPPRKAPANLTVKETAGWISQTRFQRTWTWNWTPSHGYPDIVMGSTPNLTTQPWLWQWNMRTPGNSFSMPQSPVLGPGSLMWRVCGADSPNLPPQPLPPEAACANTATLAPAPGPDPRAPVSVSAIAETSHHASIAFGSGDENVSRWFEVQRQDSIPPGGQVHPGQPSIFWVPLSPRIAFGSPGVFADNVQPASGHVAVQPLTYRVCAGNGLAPQPQTCSAPVQAGAAGFINQSFH
jgi:hypothetical protein